MAALTPRWCAGSRKPPLVRRRHRLVCRAGPGPDRTAQPVLIIGGTGRVGSSTADALLSTGAFPSVAIASRHEKSADAARARRPKLADCKFFECDVEEKKSVMRAIEASGAGTVVHTAGPFQGRQGSVVLEAAIETGVSYMDVCDDTEYSRRAKKLSDKAAAAGVPAIITGGIYPGVSNVMAAHMTAIARREYTPEGLKADTPDKPDEAKRCLYSYYTAGTGGAGPTILATSLLLAGEDVEAFKDGEKVVLPPISNRRVVDFGPGLGRKSTYLYNLPEVASTHELLGIPSVSARFGTDPEPWNWGMWLAARMLPKAALKDAETVKPLVALLDPIVRLLDPLVGERVAMEVEVEMESGVIAGGLYRHKKLSEAVGQCTAVFATQLASGGTAPGVWYPEEPQAIADRRALLEAAAKDAEAFILNRPPWMFETEAKQIGMGLYW
ncbi:unnamed protein product [Pedinophyceae sp. YPF-701]|nr:unnamed protein product [Pedinophyceae sp. YPF-701]